MVIPSRGCHHKFVVPRRAVTQTTKKIRTLASWGIFLRQPRNLDLS